jgi:hypothetical protein
MPSRCPHDRMNGSCAWTADRARAADIVNAEPPPDERVDSIGPQVRYRYRCRAPGTGWTRAGALAAASIIAAINTRLRRRCRAPGRGPQVSLQAVI